MCDCAIGGVTGEQRTRDRDREGWQPEMNVNAQRGLDIRRMACDLPGFMGLDHCQSAEAWSEIIANANPDIVDETTQFVWQDGDLQIPSFEEATEQLSQTYWGQSPEETCDSTDHSPQLDQVGTIVIPADQFVQMMDMPELRRHEIEAERAIRRARTWDPMNPDNDFFRPDGLIQTGSIPPNAINPTITTMGDHLFESVESLLPLEDIPPEVMGQIRDFCDVPQRASHLYSSESRTFSYRDEESQERSISVTLTPRVTYFQHLETDGSGLQVERATERSSSFQSEVADTQSNTDTREIEVEAPLGGAQIQSTFGREEERSRELTTGQVAQVRESQGHVSHLSEVERFQADVNFGIEVQTQHSSRGEQQRQHVEGMSGIVEVLFSMASDGCVGERR